MALLSSRGLRSGASSPALKRLKRLRLSLTVLFTIALGIGLAVLAVVVLHKDSELRRESLESVMRSRVTGSSRLIYYSGRGVLRLDGLRGDDLTKGAPEVRVYAGTGPRPHLVFESAGHHLPLAYPELAAVVGQAVREERLVTTSVADPRGGDVRLVATPFYRDPDGGAAGAVISASPLAATEDAHRQLIVTIAIGCGALLVLAAGAGFLLAGRSLRPAARSIVQQEALLADAAHELRTPVASLRALLEAARLDPASSDASIEKATTVAARMGDTLDTLLAWGRLEAGIELPNPTALRLDQVVEDLVAELPDADAVAISTSPTVVRGDPLLLRSAIGNLLDNAMRHGATPNGPAAVTVVAADGVVTISDDGPGLPDELLEKGIERFRSEAAEGTGLGLSLAQRIAEIHGGSLRAERRDGRTVISLSLPVEEKPAGPAA